MRLSSSVVAAGFAAILIAATPDVPSRAPKDLPIGVSARLWELSVPPSATPTPERIALGALLFNDKKPEVRRAAASSRPSPGSTSRPTAI